MLHYLYVNVKPCNLLYALLMMISITVEVFILFFTLFKYQIEKRANRGRWAESLWHQVEKLGNRFRVRSGRKKNKA